MQPDQDLSTGNLPPEQAMKPAWNSFLNSNLEIFTWLVAGITFLWITWLILKKIPIFGQIIIAVIPPFRQFERAGVFALWTDLFNSIITLDFGGIIRALLKFMHRSGKYMVENTVGRFIGKPKVKSSSNNSDNSDNSDNKNTPTLVNSESDSKSDSNTNTQKPEEDTNMEDQGVDATQESTFTAEQHRAVEDKLQMCISEKLLPEYDSMSFMEKMKIKVENNQSVVTCKAESVSDFMKMKYTT